MEEKVEIKFYYNGVRVNKGYLQKYWIVDSTCLVDEKMVPCLRVHAWEYSGFSAEIHRIFNVKNDSDSMTDYFDKGSFNVTKDHPYYEQVLEALNKSREHDRKRREKRESKFNRRAL